MGDVMLLGVLRMPLPEKYDENPLTMTQFVSHAREAADRIEADAKVIEDLRAERDRLREAAIKTLTWLTNPNTHDDSEIVTSMFRALWESGYDKDELDRLAMVLIEHGLADKAALARRKTGGE